MEKIDLGKDVLSSIYVLHRSNFVAVDFFVEALVLDLIRHSVGALVWDSIYVSSIHSTWRDF